jgi:formylglycine-generating enzyme required for sulfatase activity
MSAWDAATSAERQEAAERVAGELRGFLPPRLQRFTCAEKTQEVAVFTHRVTGLEFSLIPCGEFTMRAEFGRDRVSVRRSARGILLRRPYLIARTQVTQGVWRQVMGGAVSGAEERAGIVEDHPVTGVSWDEAEEFCDESGLRLPSEAEWEWACRAGSTTRWAFGDDDSKLADYAWTGSGNQPAAWAVGKKLPNAFGLHDMHSELWEWCADEWHPDISLGPTDGRPWIEPPKSLLRVVRGGIMGYPEWRGGAADRFGLVRNIKSIKSDQTTFRPVVSVGGD